MTSIGLFRRAVESVASCIANTFTLITSLTQSIGDPDIVDIFTQCETFFVSEDGLKLYMPILQSGSPDVVRVYEIPLLTAYDLTTFGSESFIDISTEFNLNNTTGRTPDGIWFSKSGEKLYIEGGDTGDKFFAVYTLAIPFNLSTAIHDYNFATIGANHNGFTLNKITKIYVDESTGLTGLYLDEISNTIGRFTLSTAWDIRTIAVQSANSYPVGFRTEATTTFSCSGLSMVSINSTGANKFSMPTAYNADSFTSEGAISFNFVGVMGTSILRHANISSNRLYIMANNKIEGFSLT